MVQMVCVCVLSDVFAFLAFWLVASALTMLVVICIASRSRRQILCGEILGRTILFTIQIVTLRCPVLTSKIIRHTLRYQLKYSTARIHAGSYGLTPLIRVNYGGTPAEENPGSIDHVYIASL